jgi:hypothetical protein
MGISEMVIKYIIFGDDVRHEVGNKLSLMGIVGSSVDIDSKKIPKGKDAGMFFACILCVENINHDNDPEEFTLTVSISMGDAKVGEMVGRIQASGVGREFYLPVPRFQLSVKESTILSVYAKIEKDAVLIAEHIASLNVNLKR